MCSLWQMWLCRDKWIITGIDHSLVIFSLKGNLIWDLQGFLYTLGSKHYIGLAFAPALVYSQYIFPVVMLPTFLDHCTKRPCIFPRISWYKKIIELFIFRVSIGFSLGLLWSLGKRSLLMCTAGHLSLRLRAGRSFTGDLIPSGCIWGMTQDPKSQQSQVRLYFWSLRRFFLWSFFLCHDVKETQNIMLHLNKIGPIPILLYPYIKVLTYLSVLPSFQDNEKITSRQTPWEKPTFSQQGQPFLISSDISSFSGWSKNVCSL